MNYPEALEYLESFINYERIPHWCYKESLKLERIKEFLRILGNPQESLNCFHIAGSKGKGSTCAFLAYTLREAGFKIGLYTSPHLSDFRERIRILNPKSQIPNPKINDEFEGMIPKEEVVRLAEELKPSIEEFNKNSKFGPLSFFEVYTTLAFLYFRERKVDFVVLETGLGGRLDATNVVNSLVCAITPISYEHTQKLGSTLEEIAYEKAGIIKKPKTKNQIPNPIVICAPQEREVIAVVRKKCKDTDARLYEVNKDIFFEKTNKGFNVLGLFGEYPNLEIRLLGDHQLVNATVAVGIVDSLRFYNIIINNQAIRDGLYSTIWPGRCEVVSQDPWVVLDGAQNIASASALKDTIKNYFKYKRLILVLGISKDKDIKGICGEFVEISDMIILTKADNPRATEPQIIKSQIPNPKSQIFLTKNSQEAIEMAKAEAKEQDLILVTGSLFLVGEIRAYLKQ